MKRVVVLMCLVVALVGAPNASASWERVTLNGSGTWVGPASGPARTLSIKAYVGRKKLRVLGGPSGTTWRGHGALLNVSLGKGAAHRKARFRIRYSTLRRPIALFYKIS